MFLIKSPAWREGISNFTLMLSVNLLYESIHRLRALGQPVYGFIGDSIAIAALFALGMHLLGIGRRESDSRPHLRAINEPS